MPQVPNKANKPGLELRNRLLLIIIVRVMVLTPVLAFASFYKTQPASTLFGFWVIVYLISLLHLAALRFLPNLRIAFYLQMVGDLALVTLLVYKSGVLNSIFIPLYLLVITYSSVLDQRRGGMFASLLSTISFVGIVNISYLGWVRFSISDQPLQEVIFRITLNLISFAAVGFLGVYLSELQTVKYELVRKEDSLAELQALHRNIVNSIRSGLLTTDLKGLITSFNPAAEEITGYSKNDMFGELCSTIIGEAGLRRLLATDFSRFRRERRAETWVRDAAGRWRFLGFTASPLRSQSEEAIGFIVSFQDLTEIKKLEEEVQLKAKMAAIGSLAAGIAHELRNPLGSIAGSVQMLKADLEPTGDRSQLLDIVLQESARLNQIIEDFLTYAKPKRLKLAAVALENVVDDTLKLVRNDPRYRNYDIRVARPEGSRLCLANSDQMKQVFWNLITNAFSAMPDGGELTVRTYHSENYVKVAFRDNGVGMTRKEREKLFQPFASGFANGVGLGMAIVYQIMQRHRGKIVVRSRKKLGTTIILALPVIHPASEFPESQSDAAASGKIN
ncbi:MAG TPA: ATP-binding protein [Acidobacteriota bacterium]|jgi:two-component system sensor histidine kinase PilS (NtrC family)